MSKQKVLLLQISYMRSGKYHKNIVSISLGSRAFWRWILRRVCW